MSTLLEAPPRPKPTSHRRRRRRHRWRTPGVVVVVLSMGAAVAWRGGLFDPILERRAGASTPAVTAHPIRTPTAMPSPPGPASSPSTARTSPLAPGPINTAFPGLTTFRGNATRDWYGKGPLPKHPEVLWRYPASGGMCASSTDNHGTRTWCGTGWTGQPNVIASKKGRAVEIRFGAYDDHYHFLDGRTGQPLRPDLVTGDLAKGSATSDPDGYPLYYGGSRDNFFRVIALDRPAPTVLWSLDANANPNRVWNDDWDGAPLVIGDYLLEGGENSWFYVVRLHRHYDKHHLVQVRPVVVMQLPGYDDQLLRDIGDTDVSIENSVAFDPSTGVAYFSNSGGLVQGWDVSDVLKGGSKYRRVFRFWDGDDTDASVVIDPDGFLYVGRKMEDNVARPSAFARDHQIGSLMKLDPRRPSDPVVWSVQLGGFEPDGGVLGTPAYYRGIIYATFTEGGVAAIDARTGTVLWTIDLPGPTWMSPVPVDRQLLVGDCAGVLHDFDISGLRTAPRELWSVQLDACIESTPAVWKGMIWVGSRGGAMYGIGDR